jgi:hypothetical protein
MKIVWTVTNGVPPFRSWGEMKVKNTPVPRKGEYVKEGNTQWVVFEVVWNYPEDSVFVHLVRDQ